MAAFAIVAMLPTYFNGVPSGNDEAQHYQFAWTVDHAIANGTLYPSYASESNHGYGDVGIRFYPPLASYVLTALNFVTRDWYFASLLAFTSVFFFGGLGIYLWVRDEFEPPTALLAAAIYTFAPYHLNEIYNNFLLAEFFATAIVPWCFLFTSRVCRGGSRSAVVGLAIAGSLLVLTHLPLTVLCAISLPIYALVLLERDRILNTMSRFAIAAVSVAAMTAFYWSRWIWEIPWVRHSSEKYISDTWAYGTNFLLLPSHFTDFGADSLNLWFADTLLLAVIIIMLPTLVLLITGGLKWTRTLTALAVTVAVSVLFTTPVSGILWRNIGFLQKVQFPWRWLAIVSALAAAFAAVGVVQAFKLSQARSNALATVGLGLALTQFVFLGVFLTRGPVYISRAELNSQMSGIANTEACDCWWPIWADSQAFQRTERVEAGARSVEVTEWSQNKRQFSIAAGPATSAFVKTFYYPRWNAVVNGESSEVKVGDSGRIAVEIPSQASTVSLEFREPPYVYSLTILSIAAWAAVLGVMIFFGTRRDP